MAMKIKRYSYVIVVLLPFLFGIETCGVRQFFGGSSEYGPTEPCFELIPSPTPLTLAPTPAPGTGGSSAPEPAATPIIIGGIPVGVVTPLPPPLYTVTITTSASASCSPTVSPQAGIMSEPAGTSILFSVNTLGMCNYLIRVDGIPVVSGIGPGGGAYLLTVTGNHTVYLCVSGVAC